MSEDEGEYFQKDEEENLSKEEMVNLPEDENKNFPIKEEKNFTKEKNKPLSSGNGIRFDNEEKKSIYFKQRWEKQIR